MNEKGEFGILERIVRAARRGTKLTQYAFINVFKRDMEQKDQKVTKSYSLIFLKVKRTKSYSFFTQEKDSGVNAGISLIFYLCLETDFR